MLGFRSPKPTFRIQGRRHEVFIGGGDGFMGTQTHLTQTSVSPRISAIF